MRMPASCPPSGAARRLELLVRVQRATRELRTHNRLEAVTHTQRRGLIEERRSPKFLARRA